MTTKSSGFTFIELLVVVAILGVLGAVSTIAYQGYISSTEKKSAVNLMRQISLAQTEFYEKLDISSLSSNHNFDFLQIFISKLEN